MPNEKTREVIAKKVELLKEQGLDIPKEKEKLIKEYLWRKPTSYVQQMLQFSMSNGLKNDVDTIATLSVIDEVCTSVFWSELRRIEMEMKSLLQIGAEADKWPDIEFKFFKSPEAAATYADVYGLKAGSAVDEETPLVTLPTQLKEWENGRNGGESYGRRMSKRWLTKSLISKYADDRKNVSWERAINEMSLGDLVPLFGLLNNSDYMRVIGGKKSGLKRVEAIEKANILRKTRNHLAHGGAIIVPSAANSFSPSGFDPIESMEVVNMMTSGEFAKRLKDAFDGLNRELSDRASKDINKDEDASQELSLSTNDIIEVIEKVMSIFFKPVP